VGLYIQGMSSCALQEIVALRSHPTALDAFRQFCAQTMGTKHKPRLGRYGSGVDGNIGSYTEGLGESYIFHGPVREEDHAKVCTPTMFAAFILENKLGTVAEGQKVKNSRYHPHYHVQAFIFNPDMKAVKEWWDKNEPPPPPAAAAAVAPSIGVVRAGHPLYGRGYPAEVDQEKPCLNCGKTWAYHMGYDCIHPGNVKADGFRVA
jgi:hypothetical protein